MEEYHKIKTVWKRDPETNYKTLIMGEWATPEFDYLKDNTWIFTEKVDGTNIRVMWDHEAKNLRFGGKTERAQIPTMLFDKLQDMFFIQRFEQLYPDMSVCLYGEGYGAKIQKGGGNYISDGVNFVLFDVKVGDWWLKREDVEDIADKLGINIVPVVFNGTLFEMVYKVKRGFNSLWGDFLAEGLVGRSSIELKDRSGRRIITKLKHKDFA